MATLQQYETLAFLIQSVHGYNYNLGYLEQSKKLDLFAHSFNASMPETLVVRTDDVHKVLTILWDKTVSHPHTLKETGQSRITLSAVIKDGAKFFEIKTQIRESKNTCVFNDVDETQINTRLKTFMKTKRFLELVEFIDAYNQAKHEYKLISFLRTA